MVVLGNMGVETTTVTGRCHDELCQPGQTMVCISV